ncbi:unnamed protein product [Boreogadus saida]
MKLVDLEESLDGRKNHCLTLKNLPGSRLRVLEVDQPGATTRVFRRTPEYRDINAWERPKTTAATHPL